MAINLSNSNIATRENRMEVLSVSGTTVYGGLFRSLLCEPRAIAPGHQHLPE